MPLTPLVCATITRNQEASLHSKETFNSVWVIESFNPNDRFERQGEAIKAGEPILLRHCQSQKFLATDNHTIQNDFGAEFEVFTHSFTNVNKTQNLALEQRGNITSDVSTRFQLDQNVFYLETAPS